MCILIGIKSAGKLTERVNTISTIIYFLGECEAKIRYCESSVAEIIHSFSQGEKSKNIPFLRKCDSLLSDFDFPIAWEMALHDEKIQLSQSDLTLLEDFGNMIGRSDQTSQIKMLEYIIRGFEISLEDAKEKERKNKRLYITLGISAGLIFIVMLL